MRPTLTAYRSFLLILAAAGLAIGAALLAGCGGGGGGSDPVDTATVTGHVVDRFTGQPISGATAVIGSSSATSASDGVFTLNNVPVGTRSLTVTASTYSSTMITVNVVSGTNDVGNIQLEDSPPPPP